MDPMSPLRAACALSALLLGPACGEEAPPPPPDPLRACMSELPRLTVSGNALTARCGEGSVPVRLKGLNRSGLQHKASLRLAGLGDDPGAELSAYRDGWGAVVVRLPLAQDLYLDSAAYRDDVDRVVSSCRRLGLYLILEDHGYSDRLNIGRPDARTADLWQALAGRYGGDTHVLFDLLNEPHDIDWPTWRAAAEDLLRVVRGAGAQETLVLLGGVDWAYDLSALTRPEARITGLGPVIYATHPYPFKGDPPHRSREWDRFFGEPSRHVPVILGEYGVAEMAADAAMARAWMAELHEYVDRLGLSALAWSAGDAPHLTEGVHGGLVRLPDNPPDPSRPTDPYGLDVRAWMTRPL